MNIRYKSLSIYSTQSQSQDEANKRQQLKIAELCEADYGFYIWPSAKKLAKFLFNNRASLFNAPDSNVLELGSGTCLPSIVAFKYCNLNQIILTDKLNDRLLGLMTTTLALNGISYSKLPREDGALSSSERSRMLIADLDWSCPDSSVLKALPKLDFLIGSDVFFDSKYFEDLIALVAFLIRHNNENLVFYTTYEIRSANYYMKLYYLCSCFNLLCEQIDFIDDDVRIESTSNDQLASTSKTKKPRRSYASRPDSASNEEDFHEIILLKLSKK